LCSNVDLSNGSKKAVVNSIPIDLRKAAAFSLLQVEFKSNFQAEGDVGLILKYYLLENANFLSNKVEIISCSGSDPKSRLQLLGTEKGQMKALHFLGEKKIELIDLPTPEIRSDEVLIEIQAAGLCGSDLHLFYTPSRSEKEAGIFGLKFPPDNIPGHEPCGKIVEVGSNVKHLKIGDRVAVAHISGCGNCSICRKGWDMHCAQKRTYGGDIQGAFAEFMPAKAKDCVVLPENISYLDGAFYTCGASTGYYSLKRGKLVGGETILCVGLGPVGLAGAYFASMQGARVIGVDISQDRCNHSLKFGVDVAINASTENVQERIAELTNGAGCDVAIDYTGAPEGRITAIEAAGLWGRVVLIGFGKGYTNIETELHIIEKQLTIVGAWVFSFPELQELVAFASEKSINLANFISTKSNIDNGSKLFADFDKGSTGKTFITK
jgi:L-iditol 2-dehydrogenase